MTRPSWRLSFLDRVGVRTSRGSLNGLRLAPLFLLAVVCVEPPTRADAGPAAPRERVVARVGSTEVVTVGELEDRIAGMPAFQRSTYGATADAIRRKVLTDVIIDDRLLEVAAARADLVHAPATAFALEKVRAMATIRALRARVGSPSSVSAEDVRAYYEANRSRYHSEERIAAWRILCPTRDEAQLVIDSWRQRGATPSAFADLAREHSRDKATYLRGGDLGFLAPDGSSSFSELRVDPAIFRAADGVRDGEIVSAPVVESDGFGVVWRRGTIRAVDRTLDEVAVSIRDQLSKDRVKEETDRLVASLRASRLRDLDTSPLETLEIDLDAGLP